MQLSRRALFTLATITLFGFSAIGLILVLVFQGKSLAELFTGQFSYTLQVFYGCCFGLGNALISISIIQLPVFTEIRNFFSHLFTSLDVRFLDILYISFAAGVGEELLFRGGIQYYLGIWLTAFVFILLHGYLDPRRGGWLLLGIYMILMSAGLGYLFEYCGLVSAMVAHGVYDLIVIGHYRRIGDSFD